MSDELYSDEEVRAVEEQRRDRIAEMTPAPSSLPPRVLVKQRHNRERLEMLRRHEAEQRELHEPDCPRPAHGGPCHGPLRFELAETELELYELRVEAIEAVLRDRMPREQLPASAWGLYGEWVRQLAEACLSAAETGI